MFATDARGTLVVSKAPPPRDARPNHVLVYQVRVQLDGSIVCSLPVEQGVTVAHRRLGDRLLRVRFAPLPADASREDGKAREKLKRQIVRGDDGPLKVAGRSFVHLVHKDAEKSEEQSALWFVAVDKNKGSPELALQYVPNTNKVVCYSHPLDLLEFQQIAKPLGI